MHYTFHFYEALSIPHHAWQKRPLHILKPRKVQQIDAVIEGQYRQTNYVADN